MTSLAVQLQAIGHRYRSLHDHIERKSRVAYGPNTLVPSLLFTGVEAADQSADFVYELGMEGLEDLATQNEWWRAAFEQKDSFLMFSRQLNRANLVFGNYFLFVYFSS